MTSIDSSKGLSQLPNHQHARDSVASRRHSDGRHMLIGRQHHAAIQLPGHRWKGVPLGGAVLQLNAMTSCSGVHLLVTRTLNGCRNCNSHKQE